MTTAERLDVLEREVVRLRDNDSRILDITERVLNVLMGLAESVKNLEEGQKRLEGKVDRLEGKVDRLDVFTRGIARKLLSPAEIAELEREAGQE